MKRSLQFASEGHYGKAIRALSSMGIAPPGEPSALEELRKHHPCSSIPPSKTSFPSPLVVAPAQVVAAIKTFPLSSSPGFSQLRVQHLLDVICNCTSPSSQDCLYQLTRWLNLLLSGKAHPLLAPWICGAQLTALIKPNNRGIPPHRCGR